MAFAHRLKRLVKGGAGHGLIIGKMQTTGLMAIGAKFPLKSDFRDWAHNAQIQLDAGRKGTSRGKIGRGIHRDWKGVHHRGPDRQAHFQRPQLFKPLALL